MYAALRLLQTHVRRRRPSLRPALRFLSSPSTAEESQRVPPARPPRPLCGVLHTLRTMLEQGMHVLALRQFNKELADISSDNPSRFLTYEKVIDLFIHHKCYTAASIIYGRMSAEGFLPSHSLRSRMFILDIAAQAPTEEALLVHLGEIFLHQTYDEHCLRDLLQLMATNMRCGPGFIDTVVRMFLRTRPPGYALVGETVALLVQLLSRNGSQQLAQSWLTDNVEQVFDNVHEIPHRRSVAILRRMVLRDPRNTVTYQKALHRMNAAGEIDLPSLNAILAAEAEARSYDTVFTIYRALIANRALHNIPDAYTFGTLFRVLRRIYQPRSLRSRAYRRPADAPLPRALFRDMLTCHYAHTDHRPKQPTPVLSTSVLNKALRTFMGTLDYPAVLVVLRTFRVCAVPIDIGTYRIIFGALLYRLRPELVRIPHAREPTVYWAYQFLGLASRPSSVPIPFGPNLLEALLKYGAEPRISLEYRPLTKDPADVIAVPPKLAPCLLPSPSILIGTEPCPVRVWWDIAPLERIIRRALLAECWQGDGPSGRIVSTEITAAKEEMTPADAKQRLNKKKKEKKRK